MDPIPQRDGATVFDFFRGPRYPILEGYIRSHGHGDSRDLTTRNELEDKLRAHTSAIVRADGILRWFPSGFAPRRLTVRLLDQVQIKGGAGMVPREFQVALIAADPVIVSDLELSQATAELEPGPGAFGFAFSFPFSFGDVSSGGTTTVVNTGNVEARPRLRVYGQITSPRVANLTTGQAVALPGLALSSGDYAEIDCGEETVRLNGGDVSLLSNLDVASSEFWTLASGQNAIQLTAAQFESGAYAQVVWRDAWA